MVPLLYLCLFLPQSLVVEGYSCSSQSEIAILMDESGSVGRSDFQIMKNFVADFMSAFAIGPNRFTVTTFNSWPTLQIELSENADLGQLQKKVGDLYYNGGGTDIESALRNARLHSFRNARPGVPQILVLITDGQSSGQIVQEANLLKGRGVIIFCVGVGYGINENLLRSISSDSSYTLIVHSFDLLMDIKDRLSHNTCSSEINECISNPCRHGGHCQDYVGYYQCQCLNGYDGTNCEYEDLCITTSPCKNNGVCQPRGHRNYYCTCPDSWQGLNCETDVDECSRTPSLCGHGSCVNTPGSYYCNCETGWQGSNCDTDIDECSTGTPCSHGGTCNNTQGSFTCFCPSQWTGATCQTDVNECANTVYPACFNGGTCHNHPGYFTCTCAQGWTGTTCNNDINECTSSPCINCGYCLNLAGTHKCSCKVGFAGDRCQNDIDECLSSQTVCQNNGQCVNHIGGSSCQCKDAYFGPLCEKEYDLCNQSICLNNGTCSVVGGIASCTCNENYTGSFCQSETDACSSSPCLNNGTCVVSENSYACNCLGGFNGTNCEQDIDECLEEPCPTNTSCVNLHGGFTCGNCSDEVNKSSSDCSSVHDCSPAICYNNGNCSIVERRISCTCKENYTGNFCETEIDICTSSPCLNNGTCVASDDSFICNCTKGFKGTICEQDIDECLEDPCPTNTSCVNLHGGFTCSNCSDDPNNSSSGCLNSTSFCLTDDPCQHDGQCLGSANSYTCICIGGWNGTHCEEDVDECLQLPCQNNGYCLNTFGNFECLCQTGYTGFHCEQDIDECSSSPCMYGGTCTDRVGSYSCCCTPGRKGDNCSEDVDECQFMPCKNNGTCINLDGDYKCNCKADFTSKNCEEDIDECTSSPCKNGGVCENHYGGMKCRCHGGWGGTYCDGDVDECREEAPCQNGGLCTNTQGSYFCTCPTDVDSNWTGKNCTQDVNECEPRNPCQNGGTCHNTPGSYNCSCHPGFTGRNCETDIDECLAFPCLNNAICHNTFGSYWCECVDNWDGAICSIDLCKTKAADLLFLVDTSMSTSSTWFEKQLDFVKNTINKLTLDDDKFNVSVISYSTDASVDVDFNSYENKTDFMEKLGNITYQNGTTNMTKAFEAAKRVLTIRKGAAQFVFLLTDGMPLNLSEAVNGITLLRNHLMTSSFDNNLFILSQGDDVRPEGIAALSDDRFYYRDTFTTHNHEALFESFRILVDEKCTACTKTYSDETDMVFLIDIGTRQPFTTFMLQTAVLDRFTHRLKILNLHENHTQVSALTFSSDVKEILWLNSTYDPDTVKSFLSGVTIDESNSTSDVARALRFVRTEVFSENHGARLSSRKIVYLPITGYDSDVKTTFSEVQKLKSDGILIFTLGIGSEFSEDDVLSLSSDALLAVFAEEGTTDENVRMLLKHTKYHSCTSRINA